MNAVVTGSTKGIGKAIVELLVSKGINVAICSRNEIEINRFIKSLNASSPHVKSIGRKTDMSKKPEVLQFASFVQEEFETVDILVNNAGIFIPGELTQEEDGALEKMIETNLYSAYHLTRALVHPSRSHMVGKLGRGRPAKIKTDGSGGYRKNRMECLGDEPFRGHRGYCHSPSIGRFITPRAMQVVFRPIHEGEVEALRNIALSTFVDSYEHLNTPSNFKWYIDRAFAIKRLLSEIRDEESFYYFVQSENSIVGYLKLNIGSSQTEQFGDEYLEIERIYLDKAHQGKGIGQKMVQFSIEKAKELYKTKIWLGVWDQNPNAIQFYGHIGFRVTGDHVFVFGDEDQIDLIMELNVSEI